MENLFCRQKWFVANTDLSPIMILWRLLLWPSLPWLVSTWRVLAKRVLIWRVFTVRFLTFPVLMWPILPKPVFYGHQNCWFSPGGYEISANKMWTLPFQIFNLAKYTIFESQYMKCQNWPYEIKDPNFPMFNFANVQSRRVTCWNSLWKIVPFQMFNIAKKYNFLMQFRKFIKFFTINFVIFDFRQISNILMFSSNQFVPDWSCFESLWTILNLFEPYGTSLNQFRPDWTKNQLMKISFFVYFSKKIRY